MNEQVLERRGLRIFAAHSHHSAAAVGRPLFTLVTEHLAILP
jgi:hypothetical protein